MVLGDHSFEAVGWVKVKNPSYWRRDAELEAMAWKHERRTRRLALGR